MGAILCLTFVILFSSWKYGAVMPKDLLITQIVGIIGFVFAFIALIGKEKKKIFKTFISLPGFIFFILVVIYILVQAINNSYIANPAPHYGLTWQNHIPWLPNSADTTLSLSSLLLFVTYYFVFLTTKIIINSKKREDFLFLLIICNGGLIAILAIMQYLAPQKFELALSGRFVNINNYVAYINLLIPVTLAYGRNRQLHAQNKQAKSHPGYIFYFIASLMIYSVFVSSCLTGIAVCFAIVVTMLFIELFPYLLEQRHLPVTLLKILAVSIPIFIIATMLSINGLDKLKTSIEQLENADSDLNGRAVIFDATWKMFSDGHELYGVGSGTFKPTSIYYLRQDTDYKWYPKFAHSDILQYLTELGTVGFTLLCCFILAILLKTKLLKSFLRKNKLEDKRKHIHKRLHYKMQIAIIFGLGGLFVHSLVDFPLHIPAITILAVILAALLKRYPSRTKHKLNNYEQSTEN
ncbi:MAG: O-antigen ligase family protein [Kiritimatiellae bacterium]|jgi:O-antigen ligase|nr:O-antigen ligase family protein [Kiritimatiellia bacterium]